MEAGTGTMREVRRPPEVDEGDGEAAVRKAAATTRPEKELSGAEQRDALAWFMSEEDESEVPVKVIQLNVGIKEPRWIDWSITAVPRGRIKQIRKEAQEGGRGARRAGIAQEDDMKV